jgi:hypothetical protein
VLSPADERQGTHWQNCWRAHHDCAISLLDKILREDMIGPEEARRQLTAARAEVCGCGCHRAVQPGLVPCSRCDGTGPL